MKYFVTGGAGFIGSCFVRTLLNDKSRKVTSVTVMDNLTYAGKKSNLGEFLNDPRLFFIESSILDRIVLGQYLTSDHVLVHFAAETHVDRSIHTPSIFAETNILGTQTLLEMAVKKNIKLFLHISTDEVYGSITSGSSSEESKLKPNSPYSASKAAADLIVRSFVQTYDLDARITRSCNNYGPHQNSEKFIPTVLKKMLTGSEIPVYGDGKNIREWIHVEDHCHAIQNVIESGKKGETYNIGSDESFTNLELIKILANELGVKNYKIKFVEDRKGHDTRYCLNSNKIRKELNFEPSKKIAQSIREFAHLYESNGANE
jgi:dTDP-glucose 4,6-dehydratase